MIKHQMHSCVLSGTPKDFFENYIPQARPKFKRRPFKFENGRVHKTTNWFCLSHSFVYRHPVCTFICREAFLLSQEKIHSMTLETVSRVV